MQVAWKNDLHLNSTKCTIRLKSKSWYGIIYSENGVNPDPEKITDLSNMSPSTCKKELQNSLSLLTYMSPFTPNLADKTYILRDLLKKETMFLWEEPITNSLKVSKERLTKT